MTSQQVSEHFKKHGGEMTDVYFPKGSQPGSHRGFCYITFTEDIAVHRALANAPREIDGTPIGEVRVAEARPAIREGGPGPRMPSHPRRGGGDFDFPNAVGRGPFMRGFSPEPRGGMSGRGGGYSRDGGFDRGGGYDRGGYSGGWGAEQDPYGGGGGGGGGGGYGGGGYGDRDFSGSQGAGYGASQGGFDSTYGQNPSGYGGSSSGFGGAGSAYSASSPSYGAPAAGYGAPTAAYGSGGQGATTGGVYGSQSASYGVPYGAQGGAYGGQGEPTGSYAAPSGPSGAYGAQAPGSYSGQGAYGAQGGGYGAAPTGQQSMLNRFGSESEHAPIYGEAARAVAGLDDLVQALSGKINPLLQALSASGVGGGGGGLAGGAGAVQGAYGAGGGGGYGPGAPGAVRSHDSYGAPSDGRYRPY
jgi:hypothetical protein